MNIAYAGDRETAVDILRFIMNEGVEPKALLVPSEKRASHDQELIDLCGHLEVSRILRGDDFRRDEGIKKLETLDLDYIISVHFPYIYPKSVLDIPEHGVINLHPAYLPFNRGWHTPTWAIYDDTPYGATLHFMNEDVDEGDIIDRVEVVKRPDDTANDLYQKALKVEKELFKKCWTDLVSFDYTRMPQDPEEGTKHSKDDIKDIQKIDLAETVVAEEFIKKLRALTTDRISEAAYFKKDEKNYHVQINVKEGN
ncbi:MAG: formyltransferase family protein [Thermoplasmatota archaeon]